MERHADRPIGIFDSGVGGLTVVREIFRRLPEEEIIYFGDTARYPYGPRSAEIVTRFARQDAGFMVSLGVKFLVVACHTASAFALEDLRKKVELPLLGVIEPGARAAVAATRIGRIGVIGTRGTIASSEYLKAIGRIDSRIEVVGRACPLFVSLAEEGWTQKEATRLIAREYLSPLREQNIDTLILGCTHYPLLKEVIASIMGEEVLLIDSAEATARVVAAEIEAVDLLRQREAPPRHRYFVSDAPETFVDVGSTFLGNRIGPVQRVDVEQYEL